MMKKFKNLIFVFVFLFLAMIPKQALALNIINEDECKEGDYVTGPVSFMPAVDVLYSNYNYLFIKVLNVEEDYIIEVVIDDYKEKNEYETVLPIGTYELMDIRFEETTINTAFSMSPSHFVVTENGVEGVEDNVIWVNVKYEQYVRLPESWAY